MKKCVSIILVLLITVSLFGCDSSKIYVGYKDNVAYFRTSEVTPEIFFNGAREPKLEESLFLEKLSLAIDGKASVPGMCNCISKYTVKIDDYIFGLHDHGITVTMPSLVSYRRTFFIVNCTEEEMNELLDIIASVK